MKKNLHYQKQNLFTNCTSSFLKENLSRLHDGFTRLSISSARLRFAPPAIFLMLILSSGICESCVPLQPIIMVSSSSVCQGATNVPYSVNFDAQVISYAWSYNGNGATISGNGNSITINFSGNATSGTLSITAFNNCGASDPATLGITVNTNPAPPTSIDVTVCANELPATLTDVVPNGIKVDWYDAPIGGNLLASNIPTLQATSAGTYWNEAINPITGCISTTRNPVVLTVNPNPAAPTSVDVTVCANQLPATLTAVVPNGTFIYWYDAPAGGNLLQANSNTYNTSTAGTYWNEAVDQFTGCTSLTRNPTVLAIKPLATSTTTVSVCSIDLPYVWNGNNYFNSGIFADTIYNGGANGCDSVAILDFTVHYPPNTPNISGKTTVCDGSSITLSTNPSLGYSYCWQNVAAPVAANWQKVGSSGITADNNSNLVFSGNTPYLGYREGAMNGYKASVMKFDGANWVNVGNAGFSASFANGLKLAIINNVPYVV